MSTAPANSTAFAPVAGNAWAARLSDYKELTKLRLSLLVLVVTAAGYALGADASASMWGMSSRSPSRGEIPRAVTTGSTSPSGNIGSRRRATLIAETFLGRY